MISKNNSVLIFDPDIFIKLHKQTTILLSVPFNLSPVPPYVPFSPLCPLCSL